MNWRYLFFVIVIILVSACGPANKDAYLHQFEDFVAEVASNGKEYDAGDWEWAEKEFDKFSGRYYDQFREELSWREAARVKKYEIQYYYYSSSQKVVTAFDELFSDEGQEKLIHQVEFYVEHEMEDDLRLLVLKAEEKSIRAKQKVMSIIKDLGYSLERVEPADTEKEE